MKKTNVTKSFDRLLLSLLTVVCLSAVYSCSSNDGVTIEEKTVTKGGVPYYEVIHKKNVHPNDSIKDPMAQHPEMFFSFEYDKVLDVSSQEDILSDKWDMSFSGIANAYLGGNYGQAVDSINFGHGGPGIGGIMIVEKPFDEVIEIPNDSLFLKESGKIGLDENGFFGDGLGWCLYDFHGTKVSNGEENNRHVVYALGNPLNLSDGTVLPARTVIIKTSNGDYAKVKMISAYKDIVDPKDMHTHSPYLYFTFDYMLAPAGSTSFKNHLKN